MRHIHAVIHKALNDALRWNRIARNPAQAAQLPRTSTSRGRMRVWSASELRAFLEHTSSDRLAAAWRLAATTGMRRVKVLGLTLENVELESARLATLT